MKDQKPKNKAAQALRALAHPDNMKRTKEQAQKAAAAKWAKWRAKHGIPA